MIFFNENFLAMVTLRFLQKNRFIHIISFLLALSSCSSSPELVQVRLKLDDLSKQWVYLCQWDGNQNAILDSVRTNSRGKAKLEFRTHTADLYAITVDKKEFPIVIVANPGEIGRAHV